MSPKLSPSVTPSALPIQMMPPGSRQTRPTINVAVVGITGAGKSTLVNVLKGSHDAEANNDVEPCTIKTTPYEVVEAEATYRIWDTRGLHEPSQEAATTPLQRFLNFFRISPDADHQLKKFLRGTDPKINLVLLCIDGSKIAVKTHWKVYTKVHVKRIKVAVVVT
ncbi:hypothetical protein BDN67DRAFT_113856 [Paxillus ammoniavirescens]|nr:hypothetical protein BDN67DRAFT_113856 [Paxillus ammoniavirescens]